MLDPDTNPFLDFIEAVIRPILEGIHRSSEHWTPIRKIIGWTITILVLIVAALLILGSELFMKVVEFMVWLTERVYGAGIAWGVLAWRYVMPRLLADAAKHGKVEATIELCAYGLIASFGVWLLGAVAFTYGSKPLRANCIFMMAFALLAAVMLFLQAWAGFQQPMA